LVLVCIDMFLLLQDLSNGPEEVQEGEYIDELYLLEVLSIEYVSPLEKIRQVIQDSLQ